MIKLFCFIAVGLALAGCGGRVDVAETDYESAPASAAAKRSAVASRASAADAMEMPGAKSDRMVTYSAWVELGVGEAESAAKEIASKVADMGGYVEEESRRSLVVFVPAKDLDGFIEYLGDDVGRILDKSKSGRDVTESHGDASADLAAARAARERYTALLKKANKVDEILDIEKELERVNAKILRLEQQLVRTTKSVDMSRVSITLDDSVLMERLAPPLLTLSVIGGLLLLLL